MRRSWPFIRLCTCGKLVSPHFYRQWRHVHQLHDCHPSPVLATLVGPAWRRGLHRHGSGTAGAATYLQPLPCPVCPVASACRCGLGTGTDRSIRADQRSKPGLQPVQELQPQVYEDRKVLQALVMHRQAALRGRHHINAGAAIKASTHKGHRPQRAAHQA